MKDTVAAAPSKNYFETAARTLLLLCIFILLNTHITSTLAYLAVFLFYATGNFKEKIREGFLFRMNIALAGFLVILFIGMFYSPALWGTRVATFWKYADKLLLFFFLIPFFTEEKWRRAGLFLFSVSIFLNMVLWTLSLHRNIPWIDEALRPFSHFLSVLGTQSFSSSVAILSYLLLLQIMYYPRYRVLLLIGTLLCIYFNFFINVERVGMITEVIVLAVFLFQTRIPRIASILVLLILCGGAYLLSPTMHDRVDALFSKQKNIEVNPNMAIRIENTEESLTLILKKPIFGWGTGSYKTVENEEFPNAPPDVRVQKAPENGFLYITAEVGIVGLAFVVAWLILQWREATVSLPLFERQLAHVFIIAFVLMSITASQFSSHFELIKQAIMVSLLFGAKQTPH